jgi:hypothetical protein
MGEWLVTVETAPGLVLGEESVDRVRDALDGHPVSLSASVRVDVLTPNVAATFQVDARSTTEASDVALSGFMMSLEAAGIPGRCRVSKVEPA